MDDYAEEKEENRFNSKQRLLIIEDCARGIYVLLKLTTDRHEASRGLSATAELLVLMYLL